MGHPVTGKEKHTMITTIDLILLSFICGMATATIIAILVLLYGNVEIMERSENDE